MKIKKILIIDDLETGYLFIKSFLEDELDCEVVISRRSVDGIRLTQKEKPQCIILDALLPGMGSIEVINSIKKLAPKVKIIIKSSSLEHKKIAEKEKVLFYNSKNFESILDLVK